MYIISMCIHIYIYIYIYTHTYPANPDAQSACWIH